MPQPLVSLIGANTNSKADLGRGPMARMLLPHLNATYSYISLAIIAVLTFYAGKYHRLVCAKQYRPILRWRLLRAMVLGPIPSMPKKDDQN